MHKPDSLLEYDVTEALSWDQRLDDGRIVVGVRDGVVSLHGAVGSFEELGTAAEDAWKVHGVKGVKNQLMVGRIAAAIEDQQVRAGCFAAIDREKHVPKGALSISVNDGLVTLSGKVHNHLQASAAKRAVATVAGVKRIVDDIDVVSEPIPGDVAARIEGALRRAALLADAHIEVSCQGETVYLDGRVTSLSALREAEDVAWNAPGVSQVVDRLVVVDAQRLMGSVEEPTK